MVIYKTTNLINNKIYIGQHQCGKDCKKQCNYLGTGSIIKKAIKKYGKENFVKEILEDLGNITTEQAWIIEEQYIQKFDVRNPLIGYNIAKASPAFMTGVHHTEETKRKISESTKGSKSCWYGKHHTEKTKKKISKNSAKVWQNKKGKDHPMYGTHLTQETKDKLSKNNAKYWKGKHRSEETKIKISESNSGEKHQNFGKHLKEKTKNKISKAVSGKNNGQYKGIPVLQYDLNGNLIKEWKDYVELRNNGFNTGNISRNCRGFVKSAHGYIWKLKQ